MRMVTSVSGVGQIETSIENQYKWRTMSNTSANMAPGDSFLLHPIY